MAVATLTFADRLAAEVERKRSQLVVGLDPNSDLLPVELRGDVARFCCGIIDAVGPYAVAVKPQLAFFEALREAGLRVQTAICVVDREEGGVDELARHGVRLRPLFTASQLLETPANRLG